MTTTQLIILLIILSCLMTLWYRSVRIQNQVIGMSVDKARKLIRDNNYDYKIVEEEGRGYQNPDKLCYNLYVKDNKVYKCEYK